MRKHMAGACGRLVAMSLALTLSFVAQSTLLSEDLLKKGSEEYLGWKKGELFVTCSGESMDIGDGKIETTTMKCKGKRPITPHEVKGEVVSVNLDGKTLTFKSDTGENKTVPVFGKAVETLKTLKAGDKVVLTCADFEKGEHQGISSIKLDKGTKK